MTYNVIGMETKAELFGKVHIIQKEMTRNDRNLNKQRKLNRLNVNNGKRDHENGSDKVTSGQLKVWLQCKSLYTVNSNFDSRS